MWIGSPRWLCRNRDLNLYSGLLLDRGLCLGVATESQGSLTLNIWKSSADSILAAWEPQGIWIWNKHPSPPGFAVFSLPLPAFVLIWELTDMFYCSECDSHSGINLLEHKPDCRLSWRFVVALGPSDEFCSFSVYLTFSQLHGNLV
jgi:hypothetical protein